LFREGARLVTCEQPLRSISLAFSNRAAALQTVLRSETRSCKLQGEDKEFALKLSSGRVIQAWDPDSVATTRYDTVGVLHGDGVFEVIVAEHIVAIRAGIHPEEKARLEKRRAEVAKMFDK
jgi:hypothetical protein